MATGDGRGDVRPERGPARGAARRPARGGRATRDGDVTDRVADELTGTDWPIRRRLTEVLHQLGTVDRAVYQAIASVRTPALDRAMRRLSNSANNSRLWLGIAAGLAMTGPAGRRAAVRGIVSVAVSSAVVNLGLKGVAERQRPDRANVGVPAARHVTMPESTSFPSGHSASAFAFATAISRDCPWFGIAVQFLAGAVAYSRVHTGVHYPGDTLAGALIGAASGQAVSATLDRLKASRGSLA